MSHQILVKVRHIKYTLSLVYPKYVLIPIIKKFGDSFYCFSTRPSFARKKPFNYWTYCHCKGQWHGVAEWPSCLKKILRSEIGNCSIFFPIRGPPTSSLAAMLTKKFPFLASDPYLIKSSSWNCVCVIWDYTHNFCQPVLLLHLNNMVCRLVCIIASSAAASNNNNFLRWRCIIVSDQIFARCSILNMRKDFLRNPAGWLGSNLLANDEDWPCLLCKGL